MCLPQSLLHCICSETRSLVNLELTQRDWLTREPQGLPASDGPALGLQEQTITLASWGLWELR